MLHFRVESRDETIAWPIEDRVWEEIQRTIAKREVIGVQGVATS